MQSELGCPACNRQYTTDNPPRIIPNCGHSLCQSCITQSLQTQSEQNILRMLVCPEDQQTTDLKEMKITHFPKNLALVKMLGLRKQNETTVTNTLNETTTTKTLTNDENNTQFHDEMTQSNHKSSKTSNSNQSIELNPDEYCLAHQKLFEVICIRDRTRICSSCAIFGEHKGHQFKSIEEVEKDKMVACDQILRIIDRKQILSLQLESQQAKEQHLKEMNANKENLSKKIKDNYIRLHGIIDLSEKKALEKLSRTFEILQPDITNVKFPQAARCQYLEWEEQALKYIKAFESNDLESQLDLLNYTNEKNTSVVENGAKVLKELEEKYEGIVGKVEQMIKEAIVVEFNNDIDVKLANYCTVSVKQQSKKDPKERSKQPSRQATPSNSRAKIQQIKCDTKIQQTGSPTKSTSSHIIQPQTEKIEIKQGRKISNDDLLIQQHKYEQSQKIFQTDINIPFASQIPHLYDLDISGSETPTSMYNHRNLDLSPIEKNNLNNQSSLSNSFIRNMEQRKIPFKGANILPAPHTKRRSKLKLPEKYEKIYESILADTAQTADFTNAQLGDQVIGMILEGMKGKKVKTLKLIRNKLTDEGFDKVWEYLENIITLNLSQNFLTDRFIDQLIHNLERVPHLKNLILSQNKIKERNIKLRIEEIKKHGIVVSI